MATVLHGQMVHFPPGPAQVLLFVHLFENDSSGWWEYIQLQGCDLHYSDNVGWEGIGMSSF